MLEAITILTGLLFREPQPDGAWGCWTHKAQPHPWEPIGDVACGYDGKLADKRCTKCHRSRPENPRDQLLRKIK